LRLDEQDPEAWYGLASAQMAQKEWASAHASLQRALALDPSQVEAWMALATVADALGYTFEAREAAKRALDEARAQGGDDAFMAGLEVILHQLEQNVQRLFQEFRIPPEKGAEERLRQAFRTYREGVDALREGNVDKAVDKFRQTVDIAPSYPRAWGNLGTALFLRGRVDEAEIAFRRALALQPNYEPARFNLEKLRAHRQAPEKGRKMMLHSFTALKGDAPQRKELK